MLFYVPFYLVSTIKVANLNIVAVHTSLTHILHHVTILKPLKLTT